MFNAIADLAFRTLAYHVRHTEVALHLSYTDKDIHRCLVRSDSASHLTSGYMGSGLERSIIAHDTLWRDMRAREL